MQQKTGTLPGVGPFDRTPKQPKRAIQRHFPQVQHNGKCVRLVPCDVAEAAFGRVDFTRDYSVTRPQW